MFCRGGGNIFTLVRQISQACTTFNHYYSCDLLMIIGLVAASSAWPVPLPLFCAIQLEYITKIDYIYDRKIRLF